MMLKEAERNMKKMTRTKKAYNEDNTTSTGKTICKGAKNEDKDLKNKYRWGISRSQEPI